MHTEVAGLLHNKEIVCVTEGILRETNTKDIISFPNFSEKVTKKTRNYFSSFC
jgi:hypothetical protein